jgi:polysaccharide export outer membrane protein
MGPRFNPRSHPAEPRSAGFSKVKTSDPLPSDWLKCSREKYRIGAADHLEIEVLDFPETRELCTVMPDGMLFFHTAGGIKAEGATVDEVKAALEAGLRADYKSPRVAITLRSANNQRVSLMGKVGKPGVYTLDHPTTLLEALANAGGLGGLQSSGAPAQQADLRHGFLLRNGRYVPVNFERLVLDGDVSQNIFLKNGDYVYLPSASNQVHVLGSVKAPKTVAFVANLTLISAIANAQGLAPGAYSQRIVIIRNSLSEPKVAIVNFNAITGGKATDIPLQPQDIVWVPNSPFERVDLYVKQVLSVFVRTVAANEGLTLPSGNTPGVGVNIGIGATP